jgi:hypothetical protein
MVTKVESIGEGGSRKVRVGCGYCAYDAEWKEQVRELAAANRRQFDADREGASDEID